MPPGRTRSAAERSSASWRSGSGFARQRRSGRCARTPRPEHGASTSARSKPSSSGGSAVPSASTTRDVGRAPSSRGSRAARARGPGRSRPPSRRRAAAPLLPPGAAQRSSTRSPSCEPTQRPGELRAAALRPDPPRRDQRLVHALDAVRARHVGLLRAGGGSPRTSRTTVSSGSFIARISASAPSSPSTRTKVSWIQSGYDSFSGPSGSDVEERPDPVGRAAASRRS